ncbi:hypothetical protein QTP70_027806 [Hemibagrus guttatus]|uniref:Integrase catalytic domain-containing protein n=1 Tax=Hemibagrus guttatus TaxID=175788 RepID=A0AAE0Q007_9TELE|nr:hypothetical protein QTP70_027806 [Hemibagrus guttatus]
MDTAECLFNHVFCYYGLPEDIVSDRGSQFTSRVWRAFFKCLGVTVSLSSGYHPQTNGQTERKIQEVGRFLCTFCHDHQESWSQFVGWAEYAQNSLRQPTTGLTPFQCVLGYQPPLFPWDGEPSDVPAMDYWFWESERVWDSAHLQLQRALRRHRTIVDLRQSQAPEYRPGQEVWLSTRDIRMRLPCKKLSPRFIGPFTVIRQINPVTYHLQLPPEYKIHPGLVKLRNPPLPLIMDEGSAYLVRDILDSRRRGGRLEYLVDWEGYGPEKRSWNNILDPILLEDFHTRHPDQPAPRGRGRPPRRRGLRSSGADRRGGGLIWEAFEYLAGGHNISVQLLELRQGHDSAADFTVKSAQSVWNDTVLLAVFREGLHPTHQAEMACRNPNTTLSDCITTAIHLVNLLCQQRHSLHPRPDSHPHGGFWGPRDNELEPMQLGQTQESPNFPMKTMIPQDYYDLYEVFSKARATQLPPHHSWDCTIDLLPNAMPPKCKVYPVSLPESEAKENYIEEALAAGFIRPSTCDLHQARPAQSI